MEILPSSLNFAKKAVYQYSLDGEFIKEWDSCSSAEKALGITLGNIGSACCGRIKTAGGFQWRYKTSMKNTNSLPKYNSGIKRVSQYTLEGKFIKTWDNSRKAALSLGLRDGNPILLCCKGLGKSCKGYIWKYAE